jgi:hypothetical protein
LQSIPSHHISELLRISHGWARCGGSRL